ncbi:cGMP-specific 3', 5'-cyclic phosphodiesterase [Sarcoptes scabiei]|uniref:Phosphodiesterase n=1 Tax=Sarcoptes scabiei TaxID=52283 RepID=A0A834VDW8_SARSC|nr:cGMP-specific 3', 5'-cyclic phosphodiesterase [Sarcoptes scabiei]
MNSEKNLNENEVREYLNLNKSFCKDWFVHNASNELIREWFNVRRNTQEFINRGPMSVLENVEQNLQEDFPESDYFGANLSKKIHYNSITSELFQKILNKNFKSESKQRTAESSKRLIGLSEDQLLVELISDITNELDMDILCHKILTNVSLLTKSDRVSLFLAKGNRNNRYLIAKLFDVTPNSLLEDSLISSSNKIPPISFGTGIVGHVAMSKQCVNIENAYEDRRFNKEIDNKTGYITKSLMCQPIMNFNGDVIGVAECLNKMTDPSCFTEKDEKIFRKYLTFCGFSIQNAQLFEMSLLEYRRSQLLLDLARTVFEDTTKLDSVITKIMMKTKSLIDCTENRVYLLKLNETVMKQKQPKFDAIFELNTKELQVNSFELTDNKLDDSMFKQALQALVERKTIYARLDGENLINDHHRADFGHDDRRTSILSVPIFNNSKEILGITQIIKDESKEFFTEIETSIMEAFAIFYGLALQSCMLYEKALKLNAHQEVSLEILSYHASATDEATMKVMKNLVPIAEIFNLDSFDFDDQTLTDDETILATIRLFIDLELNEKFQIPYQVIYHNWRHALNVAQTMFVIIKRCNLRRFLDPKEQLALIMASICHDLDHRGLNNSFQSRTSHPLTQIYSTSYMENHHFNHTMLILKSNGNNILVNVGEQDRSEIIEIIERCILSTDLAEHIKKKDKFIEIIRSGSWDLDDPSMKENFLAMLMTACDLSAICKPWPIQKRIAELVSNEFYYQGDIETSLNLNPIPMMDRKQKHNLAQGQLSFIDNLCLPLYEILAEFSEELKPLLNACKENRKKWLELSKSSSSLIAENR